MRSQNGYLGLYFAHLPNLDELTAVKASVQKRKNDKLNAMQPMCCRELIFTEPNVLVSPILEEKNQFFLVAQGTVFQSSKFKELLQRLNIQNTESVDLTRSLFQFCLSFTLKQKLAPLWNKAGEFLVQGRDFMLESSKLNAVTLELNISDKICLGLQAYSLKLQPCKPEHFTASTSALESFYTSKEAVIGDAAISDDLCFVLPSLKKGRILSITHEVPEDSPFTSYEDLRKHWKQMVAISSTQVTKCLPDSRPGLVVTRAGSASQSVRNEVASSTSSTIQEPRRNAVIQQQRQAGLDIFLNKGVCGISRSVLATDISEHDLRDQNVGIGQSRPERFATQTQAIAEQSRKRQATDLPHGEPCQRKPRQRPRIQEGVDVRGMATKDQLRKINAVTLADWLKQRGIAVKSKDKKSDLESKVMQYIAMVPRNEP